MDRPARLLTRTASVLVFAAVALTIVLTIVLPRAFGAAVLTVQTGSMTPGIGVGSVIVVRPVDPQTLQAGDVITFQKAPGEHVLVTHRIVSVAVDASAGGTGVSFVTKGDANRGADSEPVPAAAVKGKVWYDLPYLGTVKNVVGNSSVAMLGVLSGLVLYALAQVGSALRDRRRLGASIDRDSGVDPVLVPGPCVQLLLVTLRLADVGGSPAGLLARWPRADLVAEDAATFTISLAGEPEELDRFVHLLRPCSPLRVVRSDVLVVSPQDAGASVQRSLEPAGSGVLA